MEPTVAVIAQGQMGAAVGKRLTENGLQVLTSLDGRSDASRARAREAGMTAASDDEIAGTDLILSIVPPGDALALAERLAPALERGNRKPAYVDCNAVNPGTVARIEAVIVPTACPFVDAGIIGGPPKAGSPGPVFYASGAEAQRFAVLNDYGLDARRHRRDAPPRAGAKPAGFARLAHPPGAQYVFQGVSLGRRDGGDRRVRRRGRRRPPDLRRRQRALRAHRRRRSLRQAGDRRPDRVPQAGEVIPHRRSICLAKLTSTSS